MMYSIEVLGAFDFLAEEVKIGVLEYERIKGNASYRFVYENDFLLNFPKIKLSADIGLFQGIQSSVGPFFSCFGDALPDRWGRALIDKRERLQAAKNGKVPRVFDDFGYLVRIDDLTRMGALRFKYNGKYLGSDDMGRRVPPISTLGNFIREAHEIELSEQKGDRIIREDWLYNVWEQGSSLGGARPKANVIDDDDNLWIAKIPSVKDSYDVGLWEHFACTLAKAAGINVAETSVLKIGPTPYHTLLSKRFDRIGTKRKHFASSLTLTGFRDGDGADNGRGYIDIAETMAGQCGVVELDNNLAELFRRIVFNIVIGNCDDHFRNHGFLLTKDGWTLSPAYDLNPTNSLAQALMITTGTNSSSLSSLLEASDYYLIDKNTAKEIMRSVCDCVSQWRRHAKNLGIPENEQERFAKRFDNSLAEGMELVSKK